MAEPLVRDVDVLVIGAGPAGIAAACAAAEAGRSTSVIDDNPAAGGQIWRGGPGDASGDARAWLDRFARSGADLQPATAVIDVLRGDGPAATIRTRSPSGVITWRPQAVILATGARERHLPFPGWTLPGVVGAGGLQALVKQGLDVRGRRIVIGGSGPLLLAVADLLVARSARVVLVAEQAPLGRLTRFSGTLLAYPGKIAQAVCIARAIGPVLRTGTFPVAVRPSECGLVVRLASGPSWRQRHRELACDILACGFGLLPAVELARAVGCTVDRAGIVIDELGRTSVPGVWAAGECAGVGGVDKSLVEGLIAGLGAAGRAADAARLLPSARRWRRFARALDQTFRLDRRLLRLGAADTVVCRCEDVALGRLGGHSCWREAKLMTRLGMGPCQGRVCGPIAEALFGWEVGDGRPPLTAASIADLA